MDVLYTYSNYFLLSFVVFLLKSLYNIRVSITINKIRRKILKFLGEL